MLQPIRRLVATLSSLSLLTLGVYGESAEAPTSQVLAPGVRAETWNLLTLLAANASSDPVVVTAEELAGEWSPDALSSIPLLRSLPHEAKLDLMRGVAELQLLGGTPALKLARLKAFLDSGASSNGDPSAQFLLGAVEDADPAKTALYYEFASRGGSLPATMALGYRYLHGYSVPRSCDSAMQYYRHAADRVITGEALRGALLPSQMFALPEPVRLSDNHHHADHRTHPQRDQEDLSRAEYMRHRALASRKPDLLERSASITLFSGLYCSPSAPWSLGGDDVDEACTSRGREAVEFLQQAAESGSYSARALLGHVYAFSLAGVQQNVSRAIDLYQEALGMSRAAGTIAAEAANGLGLVYSYGLGGSHTADPQQAMSFFKLAADAGLADGVYNMAVMLTDAYPAHAQDYFAAAAEVGHLHSVYELARLKEREYRAGLASSDTAAACGEVVSLYKQVAEHSAELTRVLDLALVHFNAGGWDRARILYRIAAEMGSEVAQSNAAWVMERRWRWPTSNRGASYADRDYLRLVQRAADQNSPDAFIRLGDWEFAQGNHASALAFYTEADYLSHGASGRALFSIGYMHEHGLGGAIRSLERAALYYMFAGDTERVMWYPMAMLRFKLQVQMVAERLLSFADTSWGLLTELWGPVKGSSDVQTQPSDQLEGPTDAEPLTASDFLTTVGKNTESRRSPQEEATQETKPPSSLEFAAALQFTGQDSLLDVELPTPLLGTEFQDFTIESWVFVDALVDLEALEDDVPDQRRPMMLVDALDNFQVELAPDRRSARSWLLRFRKFSLVRTDRPETTVVFVDAPIESERWHHLALTFDSRTQTIALFVGGRASGQYSLQTRRFSDLTDDLVAVDPSAASRLVGIGSSLSRHVDAADSEAFWGQLARFRVWHTRMLPEQIPRLMIASDVDDKPNAMASVREQLVIDLRYYMLKPLTSGDASSVDAYVLNGDRLVPSARGVRLKMVPFPPAER